MDNVVNLIKGVAAILRQSQNYLESPEEVAGNQSNKQAAIDNIKLALKIIEGE